MTAKPKHNIICFETEWRYNFEQYKFDLNSEPLLRWLKEYHHCEVIHRQILSFEDLQHYLSYFHKREFQKYDIFYFSIHGKTHKIAFELGEKAFLELSELAEIADGLFTGKIVHFSSCSTMANSTEAEDFKAMTNAKLVSGYEISVDPMDSAIADAAYFNALMKYKNVSVLKNMNNPFRKQYASLLEDLRFTVI
jgi:hypothetical protein